MNKSQIFAVLVILVFCWISCSVATKSYKQERKDFKYQSYFMGGDKLAKRTAEVNVSNDEEMLIILGHIAAFVFLSFGARHYLRKE